METVDPVVRRRSFRLPPRVFLVLRRLSPCTMLMGMSAWGVFLTRATLVPGVPHATEAWGIELPITLTLIGLWAIAALLLLCARPDSVLARQDDQDGSSAVVVRGPGDRWRVLFVLSTPVCGLLGALLVGAVAEVFDAALRDEPLPLWTVVGYGVCLLVGVSSILPAIRAFLHGIELTPERLVAYGYYRTRTFDRGDIRKVRIADVSWWSSLLFTLAKMDVLDTLAIVSTEGTQAVLPASNSRFNDLQPARDVIQAWIERSERR